jgi:hypothetical protein
MDAVAIAALCRFFGRSERQEYWMFVLLGFIPYLGWLDRRGEMTHASLPHGGAFDPDGGLP